MGRGRTRAPQTAFPRAWVRGALLADKPRCHNPSHSSHRPILIPNKCFTKKQISEYLWTAAAHPCYCSSVLIMQPQHQSSRPPADTRRPERSRPAPSPRPLVPGSPFIRAFRVIRGQFSQENESRRKGLRKLRKLMQVSAPQPPRKVAKGLERKKLFYFFMVGLSPQEQACRKVS